LLSARMCGPRRVAGECAGRLANTCAAGLHPEAPVVSRVLMAHTSTLRKPLPVALCAGR